MYAVIKTGGKQYQVSLNQKLQVERLPVEPGEQVELDNVLLINDGDNLHSDPAQLKNSKVLATVVSHGRGKKIKVLKFKRRKHYDKIQGHRQNFSLIEITAIESSKRTGSAQ